MINFLELEFQKINQFTLKNMESKPKDLDGKLLKTLEGGGNLSFAISSDNQNIVSSCIDSNEIKLWDVYTGKLIKTFVGHTELVFPVVFSSNNQQIISGSYDKTIKLWDVESKQLLKTFQGHKVGVISVAISSDNTKIVSSSSDGEIIGWDVVTGKPIWTNNLRADSAKNEANDDDFFFDFKISINDIQNMVLSVAISVDNQVVGGCWDGSIKIWDLKNGKLIRNILGNTHGVRSVAISSDNKKIVSGNEDHTIKIWEFESGKLLKTLVGHGECVWSVAISSDNQMVVSGSQDKTIKLWDYKSGKTLTTFKDSDPVKGIGIFKDNIKFASCSEKGLIKIWERRVEED